MSPVSFSSVLFCNQNVMVLYLSEAIAGCNRLVKREPCRIIIINTILLLQSKPKTGFNIRKKVHKNLKITLKRKIKKNQKCLLNISLLIYSLTTIDYLCMKFLTWRKKFPKVNRTHWTRKARTEKEELVNIIGYCQAISVTSVFLLLIGCLKKG